MTLRAKFTSDLPIAKIKNTSLSSDILADLPFAEITDTALQADIFHNYLIAKAVKTAVLFSNLKFIGDGYSVSDQFNIELQKLISENANTIDALSVSLNKSEVDSLSAQDEAVISLTRQLSDIVSNIDSIALSSGKQLQEYATITESILISRLTYSNFSENPSIRDTIDLTLIFGRELQDIADVYENVSYHQVKAINDVVHLSELARLDVSYFRVFIDSLVNTDTTSYQISKELSENGYFASNTVKSTNKILNENSNSVDSGLLLGQSYVDNMYYFASDYVGYTQNF